MLANFDDLTGISDGFCLTVDQLPAILGRASDATVRLTNVLTSRHHCEIAIEDRQIVVRDLGSLNGIQVNGETVEVSALSSGDTLQVGLQSFVVRTLETSALESWDAEKTQNSRTTVTL